jgi:RNA polymerase sigma factor (sigma-70 family)
MATEPAVLLHHIRHLAATHEAGRLTDRELLQRFTAQRDERAFATLFRRHGPMVLRVCRRVLPHGPDAEDVFQATFLVFARKAATLRWHESAAGWLHEVAYRLSRKAKTAAARRWAHETRAATRPAEHDPLAEVSLREARAVLDDELNRLAERYRAPLVLCYLEGATRDEAAQQLGWSVSTLKRRLERGRELLRVRLERRGLGLAAVLAAVALATKTSGAVPPTLGASTLKAALLVAAGQTPAAGVVTPLAASLATGVWQTARAARLKVAAVLLTLAVLGGGTAAFQTSDVEAPANARLDDGGADRQSPPARPQPMRVADPDMDGDGLSDFQEIHKYRTDPHKRDTEGKGIPDGDWDQRRQFTYSIRSVIRVMPPYNKDALNDDFQDARVRAETKDYIELEVISYPFNTNAEVISGNPNWKKDYAGMKEYLAPGITTNWDESMRKDLLRELAQDGIDTDRLTDKEVVEQVSRWLFKRSKFRNMFCTFYVGFRDGKPEVLPGLEKAFERDRGDPKWTVQEQFEHELFGKPMFARKTYGTCTSTAVYQTTVLRALGIPTRMVLCIPLADGSDPAQVELIDKGLTHNQVRCDALMGVVSSGTSFASHTFCEVFVGGRWRRLNNTTLGQNILERNYLGLMIHVHTFKDLSEANLAATWGTRYARGLRDEVFPHSNPYRLLEVSDQFGKYAQVPNPPADKELRRVTIDKAYWPEDKDAPAEIRELNWGKEAGSGRFFVHCNEWLKNAGGHLQYKLFMWRADRRFVLLAPGEPDVSCQISMNFVTNESRRLCELEFVIPAPAFAAMAKGVAYTLHPVNGKKGYEWTVRPEITIRK